VKGPDEAGRIDLDPRSNCAEAPPADAEEFVPKATRYVFTHKVDAMPVAGLDVWLANGKSSLARLSPQASQTRPD